MPNGALPTARANEPSLPAVVLIFWAAFAVALVAARILHPGLFEAQDPDSFLRIVQVRDLLAGQGWFDLVQHRMDPPAGALLQWSRLIDAPLAFLVLVGNAVGLGEPFALTLWPILLLLGLMASAAAVAASLAGRTAAIASLFLVLFFIDPLILYFPGDIDHHNAQIAVTLATVAFALRFGAGPLFGMLAGISSALTLAIGLEMLPYVAVLGATIALRFAWTGENRRAVAAYGATIGAAAGRALRSDAARRTQPMACDSLSWSFALPALVAGLGLAALALFVGEREARARIVGLLVVGAAALAWFVGITPQCLAGPYGQLSPEVKAAFLDTVSEAQPIWGYAEREPVGAVGSLGPLLVALAVALWRARRGGSLAAADGAPVARRALSRSTRCARCPSRAPLAVPVIGALACGDSRPHDQTWRKPSPARACPSPPPSLSRSPSRGS